MTEKLEKSEDMMKKITWGEGYWTGVEEEEKEKKEEKEEEESGRGEGEKKSN